MAKIKGWKRDYISPSRMRWVNERNPNHIVSVKYIDDMWEIKAFNTDILFLSEIRNRKIDATKVAINYIKNNR